MEDTNYLEYIIPIIFLGIWLFGKIFSGNENKKTEQNESDANPSAFETFYDNDFEEEKLPEMELPSLKEGIGYREIKPKIKSTIKPSEYETKTDQSYYQAQPQPKITYSFKAIPTNSIATESAASSVFYELLKDSNSLKKAFVLSEILNAPVALRGERKREYFHQ